MMLYLEIQKGKEAMKTSEFQKYLGGTASYTKRRLTADKGCGQLTSNDTESADVLFSSLKTAG